MKNKFTLSHYSVLIAAYASLLLFGVSDNIRGPLFPEILYSFSISDSKGSWFFSVSSTLGILGAFLCPWFIKKWGEIRSLQISIILLLTSQIFISGSQNFTELLLATALFGYALAMMGVVQNFLVVQGSPEPYKNRILSGMHSMYAASSLLAPLMINFLLLFPRSSFEKELWRSVFQYTAVFSLALLLWTLRKRQWQLKPTDKIQKAPKIGDEASEPLFTRLYFAIILACYVGAEVLVSTRLAIYLRREYAGTLEESSWYTAAFFLSLLAGRVLFSFWTPKEKVHTQLFASLIVSSVLLILGLVVHPLFLALSGLSMAPFYPLMMSWAGEIFRHKLSSAIGWGVSFSNLSVLGMHIFLGAVSDWPGIRYGFMIGPLLLLIALGMLTSYEKVFRRLQSQI